MTDSGADRNFSGSKHRTGDWHTTTLGSRNALVNMAVRFSSFKYEELYRFAHHCFPWFTVVDFGCGNGAYSNYFQRQTTSMVIGVDWAFDALQKFTKQKLNRYAVCADLHMLPFKKGCVDALFSIDTLGHIRNQETAIDEICRVCRCGAPLFLHSECADYRNRWPDTMLGKRLGRDALAEIDGHFGIRSSERMRELFERRFKVIRFYSPAGILGWLLGYPEKYMHLFNMAGAPFLWLLTRIGAAVKAMPMLKYILRIVNACTNRVELLVGLTGGGSCFTCGRTFVPVMGNVSDSMVPIDIVIPTQGRPERVGDLVGNLLGQCGQQDRIMVVSQGNRMPEVPGDRRVALLHLKAANLPAARNAGIRAGGNPVVLFIDDDCEVQERLLEGHRRCYANPAVGAVAGFIDDPMFTDDCSQPSKFDSASGEMHQNFHTGQSGVTVSIMGANMSFRRSVLEIIRGFDQQYIRNALWEDVDAAFRVQNAGFDIWYCAEAKVRHLRLQTGGCRSDSSSAYIYYYFRNTAYFACTYAPRIHAKKWMKFWLYRLEYVTRHNRVPQQRFPFKHDPKLVMAGLAGGGVGCIIWLVKGHRRRIPYSIESNNSATAAEVP